MCGPERRFVPVLCLALLLLSHGHGDRVSNDLELPPVHADCFSTCSMRSFQNVDSTEAYTHSSHVQCESRPEPGAGCWLGISAGRGISSSLDLSCLPQCGGGCYTSFGRACTLQKGNRNLQQLLLLPQSLSFPRVISLITRVCCPSPSGTVDACKLSIKPPAPVQG